MANPKPPRIRPEDIPSRPADELELFKERLYFRLLNGKRSIDLAELNEAWVALEALGAVFPLLDEGVPYSEVRQAFPFPDWRDETVEVPRAALRAIISGWQDYQASETKSLGQAFGFEHLNRQGARSMKQVSRKIDYRRKIANQVEIRYRQVGNEPLRSLEEVMAEVAEMFDVSAKTVERAYADFRKVIDENLGRQMP